MTKLSSVFSSDRTIQDERVTFVVDSNIFIEFKPIHLIDWPSLCPRAKSVQIMAPATVVGEMDKHKRSNSRLRRRALEFKKLLIEIEDGDGEKIALNHDSVELSLRLMPRYSRHELTDERLFLDIADDRIVAEAFRFTQDCPGTIFLADDSNARRTAREMDIPVARPVDSWRRVEPRDQRDARIEELERQLGALPKLSISLLPEDDNEVVFQSLRESDVPYEFSEKLAEILLERNPAISRDELLRRHNLKDVGTNRGLHLTSRLSVSLADVDKYCQDYDEFTQGIRAWSQRLAKNVSQLDFLAPIQLKIENNGDAFADDVEIRISASKGFSFVPNRFVQSHMELPSKLPKPPSTIGTHLNFPTPSVPHEKDPYTFYSGSSPTEDCQTDTVSYECERFRHRTDNLLSNCLYKQENVPSGGILNVWASSASLADPVKKGYPIRIEQKPSSVDYKEYFRRHLFYFPEEISNAIDEALDHF